MKIPHRVAAAFTASLMFASATSVMSASPASADTSSTAPDRTTCKGVGGKIVRRDYIGINLEVVVKRNKKGTACARVINHGDNGVIIITHKTGCGNKEHRRRAIRHASDQNRMSIALVYSANVNGGMIDIGAVRGDLSWRTGPRC